ncbi:Rhs family protein [Vibrio parahaemolyticus]|nr:Rhs family protein [Vibrio parahaemolyticus]
MQYVVGIEEFVNAHVFDSEKVGGEEGCTIFTEDLVLNKAEYKENSELNTSGYELTERNKAKIDECLKERQKAMDARTGEEGYNAQIGNINQQSAKIGELAADDFVRSKRPNAKLLHPKDIGTSISKPGDFDMVYEVEEPPPGEIIIVEAKGGNSPLGSRKIGDEAYQQGTSKYASAITDLMAQKGKDTTEWKAARSINKALRKKIPVRYIHTTAAISDAGEVSSVNVKEFNVELGFD